MRRLAWLGLLLLVGAGLADNDGPSPKGLPPVEYPGFGFRSKRTDNNDKLYAEIVDADYKRIGFVSPGEYLPHPFQWWLFVGFGEDHRGNSMWPTMIVMDPLNHEIIELKLQVEPPPFGGRKPWPIPKGQEQQGPRVQVYLPATRPSTPPWLSQP